MFSNAQSVVVGTLVTYFEEDGVEYIHVMSGSDRQALVNSRNNDYCYPSNAVDRDLYVQQSNGQTVIHIEEERDPAISVTLNGQQFTARTFVGYEIDEDSDFALNLASMGLYPGFNQLYSLDDDGNATELPNFNVISCEEEVVDCFEVTHGQYNGVLQISPISTGYNTYALVNSAGNIVRPSSYSDGGRQGQPGSSIDTHFAELVGDAGKFRFVYPSARSNSIPFVVFDGLSAGEYTLWSGTCSLTINVTESTSSQTIAPNPLGPSAWTESEVFPATSTHPHYVGWSYLITRGTGNRSYIVSDIVHTDGRQLTAYGYSTATGNVQRQAETTYFHSVRDAHVAARAAVEAQSQSVRTLPGNSISFTWVDYSLWFSQEAGEAISVGDVIVAANGDRFTVTSKRTFHPASGSVTRILTNIASGSSYANTIFAIE